MNLISQDMRTLVGTWRASKSVIGRSGNRDHVSLREKNMFILTTNSSQSYWQIDFCIKNRIKFSACHPYMLLKLQGAFEKCQSYSLAWVLQLLQDLHKPLSMAQSLWKKVESNKTNVSVTSLILMRMPRKMWFWKMIHLKLLQPILSLTLFFFSLTL